MNDRVDPPTDSRPRRRNGLTTTQQGYGYHWQKLRQTILTRDAHICAYCGRRANSVDHIQPKADGGTDNPANLIAACLSCNTRRSAIRTNTRRAARARTRPVFSAAHTMTAPSRKYASTADRGPTGALFS